MNCANRFTMRGNLESPITADEKIRLADIIRSHSSVDAISGCRIWTGRLSGRGYPTIFFRGINAVVHKLVLLMSGAEIPSGHLCDHTCRNRICININHLRVVTPIQNTLENSISPTAVNHAKTHCIHGHEFTEENTFWYFQNGRPCRRCRTCQRRVDNKYKMRRSAADQAELRLSA